MNARDTILAAARKQTATPSPAPYPPPVLADPLAHFVGKARASYAQVHNVAAEHEIPEAVFGIIATAAGRARLCLPKESELHVLPWHRAPALHLTGDSPGAEDSVLSAADYGIAETGTLAFFAGSSRPSSWHFLPSREIILVRADRIVGSFEDMVARLGSPVRLPSTLNLVTGPSRTGDIEQTMERGAHGPRYVDIVIVG